MILTEDELDTVKKDYRLGNDGCLGRWEPDCHPTTCGKEGGLCRRITEAGGIVEVLMDTAIEPYKKVLTDLGIEVEI